MATGQYKATPACSSLVFLPTLVIITVIAALVMTAIDVVRAGTITTESSFRVTVSNYFFSLGTFNFFLVSLLLPSCYPDFCVLLLHSYIFFLSRMQSATSLLEFCGLSFFSCLSQLSLFSLRLLKIA